MRSAECYGSVSMPELASFYGIKVMMYTHDKRQHHLPHIHVWY